jgi:hypothetical protein
MDLVPWVEMTCSELLFTLFRFVKEIGVRIQVTREVLYRVRNMGKIVCHGFNKLNIWRLPCLQKWD